MLLTLYSLLLLLLLVGLVCECIEAISMMKGGYNICVCGCGYLCMYLIVAVRCIRVRVHSI